jgi:hypothetical protein
VFAAELDDFLRQVCLVQTGLDDLVVEAVKGEFEAVADAELVVDFAQVVFDDLLGGSELEGYLLVALALCDAGDDGDLLGREAGLAARADESSSLCAIGLDDPIDGLIVDPGFTGGDAAHATHEQVGRDGAGDDAPDTASVEFNGVVFVAGDGLDDELDIGREAEQLGR